MKLDYFVGLLGAIPVTTATVNQLLSNNDKQLENNVGTNGNSGVGAAAWISETPFCKMDKDEQIGPECDITITEINDINKKIRKDILGLVQTDFFKYYKFDPFKPCSIWENNEGLCFSRSCAIDVVEDWENLPEYWQPEVLGGLNNNTKDVSEEQNNEGSILGELCAKKKRDMEQLAFEGNDIDYYDVTDLTSKDAVLVDLTQNPERFTGYGGVQAGQIWKSIYAENCFPSDDPEKCLAKDAFYRIVSGLHASIGTHLSNDHLNTETGEWGPDLELFMARVGNFPERVSNIYFNYAVVAKSLLKIKPYLKELDFCNEYDNNVKSKILNIVSQLDHRIFDEELMFKDEYDSTLKDEFRMRFKNVTRIMDCVHCDRCKLWGKVQTTGYATSLKILFELNEADENSKQQVVNNLTKFELIALMNTFDRLSKSIESINNFEVLYNEKVDGKVQDQGNNFFKIIRLAKDTLFDTVQKLNGSNPSKKVETKKTTSNDSEKVEDDQKPNFADLKMPKRTKKVTKSTKNIWVDAWHTEVHNVLEAFKFIYRSYFDLPRNLFNVVLVTANKVWNSFVGVKNYVSEEESNPNVYSLDFH